MKKPKTKTEALSLRVTPALKRKLEFLAKQQSRSLNAQCELILSRGWAVKEKV